MRQGEDEPDDQTGWRNVYAVVVATLGVTLLLLAWFSRYFSG